MVTLRDERRPAVRGTMLWFNAVKDCGLISTDEGEHLHVEGSGFASGARPEGRCAGTIVAFEVMGPQGERRAEGVSFVIQPEHGRARMRHGHRRSDS